MVFPVVAVPIVRTIVSVSLGMSPSPAFCSNPCPEELVSTTVTSADGVLTRVTTNERVLPLSLLSPVMVLGVVPTPEEANWYTRSHRSSLAR